MKRKLPDEADPTTIHTAMARLAIGSSPATVAAIANVPRASVLRWSRNFPFNFREGDIELLAQDVEEAVLFAELLAERRGCDLFRGQRKDWPPIATFYRLGHHEQQILNERWRRFVKWAGNRKSLSYLLSDRLRQAPGFFVKRDIEVPNLHLIAVAQHFGFPTGLLDFTEDPRIAAFFATEKASDSDSGYKCIYCLNSDALEEAWQWASGPERYHGIFPQLVRLGIEELWRMQAQRGVFVQASQYYWTEQFKMDIIRFPATAPVSEPAPEQIYPSAMSRMEVMIERHFSLHGSSLTDEERKKAAAMYGD